MFEYASKAATSALSRMRRDVHEIVEALTAALDAKHNYTRGHSDRVADLSFVIAREMGLPRIELYQVHVAGHLHDVGKIGIPDELLTKTGIMTAEEFEIIKEHPVIGDEILKKIRVLKDLSPIVRHHHERYRGGGYPDGLQGNDIPLASRIICLADAYDAMTSFRSYRSSLTHEAAVHEIIRCAGTQFDPDVAKAFLRITGMAEVNQQYAN